MGYTLKQLICDLISEKNDNRLSSENTSKILSNINDSFNDACKSINYQYSSKYVLPLVYLYAKAIEMGDKSIDWKEVLKWDFVKNDLFLLDFLLLTKIIKIVIPTKIITPKTIIITIPAVPIPVELLSLYTLEMVVNPSS